MQLKSLPHCTKTICSVLTFFEYNFLIPNIREKSSHLVFGKNCRVSYKQTYIHIVHSSHILMGFRAVTWALLNGRVVSAFTSFLDKLLFMHVCERMLIVSWNTLRQIFLRISPQSVWTHICIIHTTIPILFNSYWPIEYS